ncbi:MAG: PilC/PilY family type IV pilus protein, partial [Pseudomonadota bacterium]
MVLCAALLSPLTQADDIDVFFPDKRAVYNPNILLNLDTSQSMQIRDIPFKPYDPDNPNGTLRPFDPRFPYGQSDVLYDGAPVGGDRGDHRFNVYGDSAYDPGHYYIQAAGHTPDKPWFHRIGGIRDSGNKYVNRDNMSIAQCKEAAFDMGENLGAKGFYTGKWTFFWEGRGWLPLSDYSSDWEAIKNITILGCEADTGVTGFPLRPNETGVVKDVTVHKGSYLAYYHRKWMSRIEAQGLAVYSLINDLTAEEAPVNLGLMAYAQGMGTLDRNGARVTTPRRNLINRDGGYVVAPVDPLTPAHVSRLKKEIIDHQKLGFNRERWIYLPASPIGEALFESLMYFTGDFSFFGGEYASDDPSIMSQASNGPTSPNWLPLDLNGNSKYHGRYESPIEHECQRNAVIMLTDGGTYRDNHSQRLILNKLNRIRSSATKPDGTRFSQFVLTGSKNDIGKCRLYNEDPVESCLVQIAETMGKATVAVNEYPNGSRPANKEYIVTNDPIAVHGVQLAETYNGPRLRDDHWGSRGKSDLLNKAIDASGGTLYNVDTANEFTDAIKALIETISEAPTTFVQATTTPNPDNALTNGNELFFPLFNAASFNRWESNVRKYQLDPNDGEIKDVNGNPVLDESTKLIDQDASGNVPKDFFAGANNRQPHEVVGNQGAASKIKAGRNMYVVRPDGQLSVMTESVLSTMLVDGPLLGVPGSDFVAQVIPKAEADKIAKWTLGYDVDDDDGDGSTTDSNEYMGDPLHSSPKLVRYASGSNITERLVFGTNQGFVHSVDATSGVEAWALLPYDHLYNTVAYYKNRAFSLDNKTYGMDGKISLWLKKDANGNGLIDVGTDEAYLFIGMRRGGDNVYALDVSDPNKVKVKWNLLSRLRVNGQIASISLGQSWGKPVVGKVAWDLNGNNLPDDYGVFMSGGYDESDDNNTAKISDTAWSTKGGTVLMVDAETGDLKWSANRDTELSNRRVPSIVNTPAVLDVNADGLVDKVFALSIDGTLWRFDVSDNLTEAVGMNAARFAKGYKRAKVVTNPPGQTQSQRFMNELNVSLYTDPIDGVKKLHIAYGSGRRPDPLYGKDATGSDRSTDIFVVVKDSKPFTPLDPLTAESEIV